MISRNHTKISKPILFVQKNLNDKICHKVRNHCHYTGKYGSAKHDKYNSKYSVPKEMLIIFRKWSNYDYHFITKKLAKKIEKKLLRKRKRRKRSTRTEKKKKKKKKKKKDITKPDLTDYKSLTVQDSWQALY